MSPHLYKLYINDLLVRLEKSSLGLCIGDSYIVSPTCADDVLLILDSRDEMQAMLEVCFTYSKEQLYILHPEKSKVVHHIQRRNMPRLTTYSGWKLGTDEMSPSNDYTHLGLNWSTNNQGPDVENKIELARSTAYALLGVGLHGDNGLDPGTSLRIISTFVTPRLLYGLDSVRLTKKDMTSLDTFYKQLLKKIQGLPDTTANEAVYLLLGTVPISRLDKHHPLRQLAVRQLSIKEQNSKSWFIYVESIARQL